MFVFPLVLLICQRVSILAFSLSSLRSLRLNMVSAFDFSGSWMLDVRVSCDLSSVVCPPSSVMAFALAAFLGP